MWVERFASTVGQGHNMIGLGAEAHDAALLARHAQRVGFVERGADLLQSRTRDALSLGRVILQWGDTGLDSGNAIGQVLQSVAGHDSAADTTGKATGKLHRSC